MFKFLKKKLKSVVDNFSKDAEEELEKETKTQTETATEPDERKKTNQDETENSAAETKEKTTTEVEPADSKKTESASSSEETNSKTLSEPSKKPESAVDSEKQKEPAEESEFRKNFEQVKADLEQKEQEIETEEKTSKGIFGKLKDKFKKKKEDATPEKKEESKKKKEDATPEKKENRSILQKVTGAITTTTISEKKFNDLFEQMQIVLLENNVALEVIDKIRADLKNEIAEKPLSRGKVEKIVNKSLKQSVEELFNVEKIDLIEKTKEKKPYVIVFAGINGSGKTTTIAKIANAFQESGLKVVMAAADTFRAAAIQQLQEHADKLGSKLIKHDYGSDPAAVAFDAVKYADAKKIDVVLVDTAGRQHSNKNLMEEIKKVVRVAKPDLKIFVGESITGNDCVEQAKEFNDAIEIDGIVLTKADVDEKGGAAISVSYVTKKPIIYLGTGQNYKDITPFNPELVVESLGLAA